jgi:A/G-specific adenine glycosylase
MEERYFSEKVVEWYIDNRRDLPWRHTVDPYKIWLSEIILQQTRVIQGLPYYLRFVESYPDVFSLASAPEQEILRLWQGLGYYSRARNLHKCAKLVVDLYQGLFPSRYKSLLTLPGIGSYTAAAIASICSQEPVAVVDGNVYRVLARVFGVDLDITSSAGKKLFAELANKTIQFGRPDWHNQAVMEFGALWCTPKQPKCPDCIFKKNCFAYRHHLQHLLPVKTKSKKPVTRYFYYFVVKKGNTILMKKRNSGDIWQGLYDFYLVEKPHAFDGDTLIQENSFLREFVSGKQKVESSQSYRHLLSHQTIISTFVILDGKKSSKANVEESPLEYYPIKKIHDLPKPVLISRFLSDYNFL